MQLVETPSDVELKRLVALAARSVNRTAIMVEVSIRRVREAGQAMAQKKQSLPHGAWMDYVEHTLGLSYHTSRNWIKLAEFAEKRPGDLEKAQTVRQAYILAGLLPESESSPDNRAVPQVWVQVERITATITAQISKRPVDQWPSSDRQALKERLRPLVELYATLEAAT